MGRFDALVLPSRRAAAWKEQFGHVLIEAMAMGIPAVGSDSGAIPEVIGRPALVFAEDDARGLERILERLARDKDWRRAAAAYGEARVRAHYTHDRIAERLVTLWDDVRRAAKC
jgi:glycosyltransferase involved in cell wall biosynthesis